MKHQRPYLDDILMRITQIERFTRSGEADFMADDRTQEAVIRCFEVIGKAIKRLDPALLALYPGLAWRDYTGFRDVLIHQYDAIMLPKVWQAVVEDIMPLRAAVEALLTALPPEDDEEKRRATDD